MRLVSLVVALMLVVAVPAMAQEPSAPLVINPVEVISLENTDTSAAVVVSAEVRKPILDKKFIFVSGALVTAMTADLWSTYDALGRSPIAYESNALAAPFVNRGPVVGSSAGLAYATGLLIVSSKMRNAKNPTLRKIWWVVPVAQTIGNGLAARHNLRMPSTPRSDGLLHGTGGLVPGTITQ